MKNPLMEKEKEGEEAEGEKPNGRSSGVVWRLITAVSISHAAEGGSGFFRREQREPGGLSSSEVGDGGSCRSTLSL